MARLFIDHETYELDEVAARLDVERDWVRNHMVHHGLRVRKIGHRIFTTGRSIRLWIEANDGGWDEKE